MRTISTGNPKPFSISNTAIAGAGWKRSLPSISASTRRSDGRCGWAAGLRAKYGRRSRRERAGFVWLRARSDQSRPVERFVSRTAFHGGAHWAPVTQIGVNVAMHRTLRIPGSTAPTARPVTAGVRAVPVFSRPPALRPRDGAPPTSRSSPGRTVRPIRMEKTLRNCETLSTVRRLAVESHRIERAERRSLAQQITTRVRRVEQPPSRGSAMSARIPVAPAYLARPSVSPASQPAPAEARRQPEARNAEPPAAPQPNVEAIAESVMRQIDRRLIAHRERLGRF